MKPEALLDSNIFIFAFEIPESNSALIIDSLNRDEFEALITESTFKEVYRYFRKHYRKSAADAVRFYMFSACRIVFTHELKPFTAAYRGSINEKDLELVVAVKRLGIRNLVSHDSDFEGLEEHKTPRKFAIHLKLEPYPTDY